MQKTSSNRYGIIKIHLNFVFKFFEILYKKKTLKFQAYVTRTKIKMAFIMTRNHARLVNTVVVRVIRALVALMHILK